MRVLTIGNMYPPHHLGGYELMWQSWVEHARGAGHEVSVLTTDHRVPGATAGSDGVARELRWYWHDHRFPRIGLPGRLRLERHNLGVLGRSLERGRPDAVAWWAMGGMSLSMIDAVRRRGIPALGVVVDDWLVYGPEVDAWQRAFGDLPGFKGAVERLTGIPTGFDLAGAATWIFVSETTRRRAREAHPNVTGHVAHAGIDPALFPRAEPAEWRWRLLYLGRIDRRKGIATAVRALLHLPPEAVLEIVGGGDDEYRAELEDIVSEYALSDRVRFSSYPRDQLAAVYASADVVVFPVVWEEPFGLVPLEAMSVGRPVVATGTGGSAEYLRDGVNCLLFEPIDDPAALADRIRDLAEDPGLRARLVEQGRATAAGLTERRFNEAVTGALPSISRDAV
jgi:glycogen synthase